MGDFLFPDVGEGIQEGKIVSIKIREGDAVKEDQVLAEVETDKAVVEIPSPQAGTITKIHQEEGAVIHVGEPLVTFGEGEETPSTKEPEAPSEQPPKHEEEPGRPQTKGTKRVESNLTPTPPAEHEVPEAQPVQKNAQGPVPSNKKRVLAAPSTRRLAREKGIDINTLQGTGPHGRITQQDVLGATGEQPAPQPPQQQAAEQQQPAQQTPQPQQPAQPPPSPSKTGNTIPYTGRRKAIGEHMETAHDIPPVTEFAEADVTELVELRQHLKPRAAEQGVKLTYIPFIAKAVCAAIHKHPVMNSSLTGENITVYPDIHLGIAVDTEQGLVVPVIQVADKKSVLQLATDIQTLADKARNNKLSLEEMQGSTFTITSIGPLRVEGFTPIINSPEAAILGIGTIQEKPAVQGNNIVPRHLVTLSLTFDHRIIDGAEAAKFLTDLVQLLEDPELLVLEGI